MQQRCRCKSCGKTFQLDYTYEASKAGVKERILQMSINGSGVADTVRVLKVGKSTVLRTIKKVDAFIRLIRPYSSASVANG